MIDKITNLVQNWISQNKRCEAFQYEVPCKINIKSIDSETILRDLFESIKFELEKYFGFPVIHERISLREYVEYGSVELLATQADKGVAIAVQSLVSFLAEPQGITRGQFRELTRSHIATSFYILAYTRMKRCDVHYACFDSKIISAKGFTTFKEMLSVTEACFKRVGISYDCTVQVFDQKNSSVGLNRNEEVAEKHQKVGVYVRQRLTRLLVENRVSQQEVQEMQKVEYSKRQFDLQYPLLLKAAGVNTKPLRYWAEPVRTHGELYYICSEWYENDTNNDKVFFDSWLKRNGFDECED